MLVHFQTQQPQTASDSFHSPKSKTCYKLTYVYAYMCVCMSVEYTSADYTYVCTLLHRRVCRNGHSKNCTSNCAPPSPTLLLWTEHGRPSVSLHDVSNAKSVLLSGMSMHLSVPAQSYCNSSVCVNNVLLPTQPLSTVQGLHLTPDNIKYYASFLHSSATIQDRVIHFETGTANGMKHLRSTTSITFWWRSIKA